MNALIHVADFLKDRLLKTPLERDLTEAMNNEKWGCSNTLLRAISDRSFGVTDAGVIMNAIWENLRASGKEWRRLYKTLVVLEYLLKHGSARCVHETQDEKFKIRILQDFSVLEKGEERGNGVRDLSRRLMDLLADPERLQQEREKARRGSDCRFVGFSSDEYDGGAASCFAVLPSNEQSRDPTDVPAQSHNSDQTYLESHCNQLEHTANPRSAILPPLSPPPRDAPSIFDLSPEPQLVLSDPISEDTRPCSSDSDLYFPPESVAARVETSELFILDLVNPSPSQKTTTQANPPQHQQQFQSAPFSGISMLAQQPTQQSQLGPVSNIGSDKISHNMPCSSFEPTLSQLLSSPNTHSIEFASFQPATATPELPQDTERRLINLDSLRQTPRNVHTLLY